MRVGGGEDGERETETARQRYKNRMRETDNGRDGQRQAETDRGRDER